ncbi:MAG: hypothetical protein KDE67_04590 [Sphingobium sp.]|nr:hypothetical protein [Sphingobium sp.]
MDINHKIYFYIKNAINIYMKNIMVLSTGVADLVTAISALRRCGLWQSVPISKVSAILIGHGISLPDNLIQAFQKTARRAFGLTRVEAFRWNEHHLAIEAFVAAQPAGSILLSNQLQDAKIRQLIISLNPGKFIFYDNGLSSYHDHSVDLTLWRSLLQGCDDFSAYLTYSDLFGTPDYLKQFVTEGIPVDLLKETMEEIRDACVPLKKRLTSDAALILGTSFDRTKILSAEEELTIHRLLLEHIRKAHSGPVFFKPHPRAGSVYLDEGDGVIPLPVELPVEAYIAEAGGVAYSYSSTALFSLSSMFDWRTFRVSHPLIEKVFAAKPQLSKIKEIEASHSFG